MESGIYSYFYLVLLILLFKNFLIWVLTILSIEHLVYKWNNEFIVIFISPYL